MNDKGICVKCVEQESLEKLAKPKVELDDDYKSKLREAEEAEFEKAAWDSEDNNLPF